MHHKIRRSNLSNVPVLSTSKRGYASSRLRKLSVMLEQGTPKETRIFCICLAGGWSASCEPLRRPDSLGLRDPDRQAWEVLRGCRNERSYVCAYASGRLQASKGVHESRHENTTATHKTFHRRITEGNVLSMYSAKRPQF